MSYFANVVNSFMTIIFVCFFIVVIGNVIGSIKVKGVCLSSAGILLVALLYGMLVYKCPQITIGEKTIVLFDGGIKEKFSLISSIGTTLFVTAIGFIAGPRFFRNFGKKTINYVLLAIIIILSGTAITVILFISDNGLNQYMASGLMCGALTSTPGFSAAKEVALQNSDVVTAGYGIAYIFGVLGVTLFVQIVPKSLNIDMEKEKANYLQVVFEENEDSKGNYKRLDKNNLTAFLLAVAVGCLIGSIYIPGLNFSLGNSGGCLLSGLLFGHFGHIGNLDCTINKETVSSMKEFGLYMFMVGSGVNGGVNFISCLKMKYFLYGALITIIPMIIGYIVATKAFKMNILNALASVTGGMTSTPALGALINSTGCDEVASAYAATYPIALVCVVIAVKLLILMS